jgi:hypothetical protein
VDDRRLAAFGALAQRRRGARTGRQRQLQALSFPAVRSSAGFMKPMSIMWRSMMLPMAASRLGLAQPVPMRTSSNLYKCHLVSRCLKLRLHALRYWRGSLLSKGG